MIPIDSQQLESYVPVYDVVPDQWEDAKGFITEQLKRISNAVNIREIGFFLDEELLSGKAFVPGITAPGDNPGQMRQVLRKVVNCSPLVPGLNTFPHGIVVDNNFTLVQMFAAATEYPTSSTATAEPIPNGVDTLSIDSTNIYITVAANWNICWTTLEYLQEV